MELKKLKEIIIEQKNMLESYDPGIKRQALDKVKKYRDIPHAIIISGMRRVGKSTLLNQIINKFHKENYYYFNFEDERLIDFKPDEFNKLYELFVEIYGKKKVFFFDEIQNIPKWELFVRRMQDKGFKFYITGSNASLLSKEMGTHLTGRHIMLSLYPFSFLEFLCFHRYSLDEDSMFDTEKRAEIKRFFQEYNKNGGMPEYLKYEKRDLLKRVYEDILYRDIVARYEIREIKVLRELTLYFMSNPGQLFSYNKLKEMLGLGSVNTVKSYIDYLENSFLIYTVNRFAYSLKKQFVANKKVYVIDNGIMQSVSFQFSENSGKFLENTVFMELNRRYNEIYYYKTKNNLEVDFLVKDGKENILLVQVCESLENSKTRNREINSLVSAMKELDMKDALILTREHEEDLKKEKKVITIKPVYKWLTERIE